MSSSEIATLLEQIDALKSENQTLQNQVDGKGDKRGTRFTPGDSEEASARAITEGFAKVAQYVNHDGTSRDEKVCQFTLPKDLQKAADIGLETQGVGADGLSSLIDKIFKYSIRSNHPRFFNQMGMGGVEPIGVLGDSIAAACNHSMYTYEMAPVSTLMEREVIAQLGALAGFDPATCDGMFNPGGSASNTLAMLHARSRKETQTKTKGLQGLPQMVAFTSAESHYCFEKAGLVLGIGTNNVIKVPVDKRGLMIVSELERLLTEQVAAGNVPFFVNATAGSTVYGAMDDIKAIQKISKKFDCWFHVDGAWGGSALFSKTHKHYLAGCENADSLTWNFHKMSGLPQSCSILLVQGGKNVLASGISLKDDCSYLYHEQAYDALEYDTGEKSIQCGRRPDVIKLWLLWKTIGLEGMEGRVDECLRNRDTFIAMLKARPNFDMFVEPGFCNVCYFYKPQENMPMGDIHELTAQIKQRMMAKGTLLVNYQPRQGLPNFWRMVFTNPNATEADLKFVLDETEAIAKELGEVKRDASEPFGASPRSKAAGDSAAR
jgi:glutamate/tyrosine decarboxylase-like PLP-dependent enzyme